jgi:cytochrome oxidase Cu insertion factor (SCO1/SenC/PrrC family)
MLKHKVGIGVTISVMIVAALVGGGIRYFVDSQYNSTAVAVSGPVKSSGTARIGGKFAMVDHRGQNVTDQDFRGKFMLIFFGYTFCPDVCPTELQTMSETLDTLGGAAGKITPVFATIDPERDTAAVLADYLSNFHARFVGLTGSAGQVADLAKTFGVFYSRVKSRDASDQNNDYLMNHSSFIFLMDDKGKFRAAFRAGIAIEGMVRRIRDELAK